MRGKTPEQKVEVVWHTLWEHTRQYVQDRFRVKGPGNLREIGRMHLSFRPPVRNRHRSRAEVEATKAYHRLHSLNRKEGDPNRLSQLIWEKRGAIRAALDFRPREIRQALKNPEAALDEWGRRLERARERQQARGLRRWKKRIVNKGRPSPAFFRWLRGGMVKPPMVMKHRGTIVSGPRGVFGAVREYWSGIMCVRPEETEFLQDWIGGLEGCESFDLETDAAHIQAAARTMKTQSAPGLDAWPTLVLKSLPRWIYRYVALAFRTSEQHALWPRQNCMVRTQLIPKSEELDEILTPSALRPIAVISTWMRLWSKWRLMGLPPHLHELHPSLRGGIRGRTLAPIALDAMLNLEESLGVVDSGKQWHVVSLDASKCFDRIVPSHAFPLALSRGVPAPILKGLGGFLLRVRRRFSCAGFLDQEDLSPRVGVLQGDPLSVLICNLCVEQWTEEVRQGAGPNLCTFSFVDDRTITSEDPDEIVKAWERSKGWEARAGWVTNDEKTYIMSVGTQAQRVNLQGTTQALPHTDVLTLLGHELCAKYQKGGALQAQRLARAQQSAQRIETARLKADVSQQALAIAALTKYAYGPTA